MKLMWFRVSPQVSTEETEMKEGRKRSIFVHQEGKEYILGKNKGGGNVQFCFKLPAGLLSSGKAGLYRS